MIRRSGISISNCRVAFVVAALIMTLTASMSAQLDSSIKPAPPNIKIADQPDSPIRLELRGVHDFSIDSRLLSLIVTNVGTKAVRFMTFKGVPGLPSQMPIALDGSLLPGFSRMSLRGQIPIENDSSEYVISVDFVLFSDGTVWGPDVLGDSEYIDGLVAGQSRILADLKALVAKGDDAELRQFLTREPYFQDKSVFEGRNIKWQNGFMHGFRFGLFPARRGFDSDGGMKGVAVRIADLEREIRMDNAKSDRRKAISRVRDMNEPVEFIIMSLAGKPTPFDERFFGSDDWVKGLSIKLKNTSGKTLIAIGLELEFPELVLTGNQYSLNMWYGRFLQLPPTAENVMQLPVRTGGTLDLVLKDTSVESLKRFLKGSGRQNLDELTRLNIKISSIQFDDETRWSSGKFWKRNPDNPERWIPVETK